MSAISSLSDLESHVVSHPVFAHRFLTACKDGHVGRRDLGLLLARYAPVVESCDAYVAAVLASCNDAAARSALTQAVWGDGDVAWAARRMAGFRDLLGAAGKSDTASGPTDTRLAEECFRACSDEAPVSASAFLLGVLGPARALFEALAKPCSDLGLPEAALGVLAARSEDVESALRLIFDATAKNGVAAGVLSTVLELLDAHVRFFDSVFHAMQSVGIGPILERIQERKSLADGPAESFVHRAGASGTPLYHNRIERLAIDFSVDTFGFRPEVLEPRLVRIPPRKNNERHRHAHETVFYIIAGHGRVLVDDAPVEVSAGDIIFVPRWAMHQTQNTGDIEMHVLAVTDFGLTGKAFVGDYTKTSRLVHAEQSGAANWRTMRAESKATEDYLAPLSVAYGSRPEIWADPYPFLERARTNAPVYFSERFNVWFVTRYADVAALLRDPRLSSRRADEKFRGLEETMRSRMEGFQHSMREWLAFMDPPEHTRVRSRLNRFFSGVACEALRPRIEAIVDGLMNDVEANRTADLIWDVASPLHFILLGEMLLGESLDRRRLKEWGTDIWAFVGAGAPTAERAERGAAAWSAMDAYIRDVVRKRRSSPRDDLVSLLFAPDEGGDALGEDTVVATCIFFLSVGHEATWDTIGNCALTLMRQPDAMAEVKHNRALLPAAVEELLRYESPVQLVARKAKEPLLVGGKQIEKGDFVMLMLGSANRDPEQFGRPDQVDFHRAELRSLATGAGIHHCIGGPLGKVEAQVTLGRLLDRWPEVRLARTDLQWKASLGLRGVTNLPVRF